VAPYQPFFCEENVWHLCRDPRLDARSPKALFVSNRDLSCAMWHQRAARRPGAPIVWDYHAVVLAMDPCEVWDPDTTLGFPTPALSYLTQSFRAGVPARFAPRFRIVEAADYLRSFSSDRAHMRGRDGRFQRPPPPWAPILNGEGSSNLMHFVDMDRAFVGEVLDLDQLVDRCARA
jgi:protein N-terminal glutamine amidohydrolase